MPWLNKLRVSNNRFTGAIPSWLSGGDLSEINIAENSFTYTESASDNLQALVSACRGSSVKCDGIPPASCDAFGSSWKTKTDNPFECIHCSSIIPPILLM